MAERYMRTNSLLGGIKMQCFASSRGLMHSRAVLLTWGFELMISQADFSRIQG